MTGARNLPEEPARGEERCGQVRCERAFPPLERELPERDVPLGLDACVRNADVDAAEGAAYVAEELVRVFLEREVRLDDDRVGKLGGERFGTFAAAVVMDGDAASLGRERARGHPADPAGGAGDENALATKARLHRLGEYPARAVSRAHAREEQRPA